MDENISVPTNAVSANTMEAETETLMVCRVCLASGQRVYSLRALRLAATYSALSGAALRAGGPLPLSACAACALRLRAAKQLAETSRRANDLLMQLLETSFEITPEAVSGLDLNDPVLTMSKLVPVHMAPDHCDLYIQVEETVEPEFHSEEPMEEGQATAAWETIDSLPETEPDCAKGTPEESPAQKSELLKQYFKVQQLSLREQMQELAQAKLSANYLESKFKCHLCFKGFIAEATYSAHMTKHSKTNGEHECPVCHVWLANRRALRRHAGCHDTLFTCKHCALTTKHRTTATLHARWHRGTVYKCDLCTEEVIFTRPTSLLSHLRLRHPGSRHCPLCGYSFLGEKGLSQHIVLKHAGETLPTEGPRCEECNVTFANDDVSDKHQKITHQRCERNQLCHPLRTEADKRARRLKVAGSARNRKTPAGAVGAENAFTCADCGESHATRLALRRHTRAAHGCSAPQRAAERLGQRVKSMPLRSQCHVCGRLFRCAALLTDHLDSHSSATAHACPDCGKRYKTRLMLQTHRRGHTARYLCPLCQRAFNSSGNRDRHYTYVHSTVRDIKCEFCDKTFKCMLSRHQHEKYVHLETPWPKRKRTRKPANVES